MGPIEADFDVFDALSRAGEEPSEEVIEEQELDTEEVDEINDQLFADKNKKPKATPTAEEEDEEEEEESEEEEDQEDEDQEEEEESEEEEDDEEEEEAPQLVHPSYSESIRSRFPDREFNSMEDYEAAVAEIIEAERNHDTVRSGLLEIASNYPEFAGFVASLKKGESWRTAIIKSGLLPEDLQIEDSEEEDAEQVVLAKRQEKERREQAAKKLRELEENQRASQKVIETYQKDNQLSDEDMNNMLRDFQSMMIPVSDGKMTKDILDKIRKITGYDKAVKTAKAQGEIEGRNQKIKTERKKIQGDRMPRTTSGPVPGTRPKKKIDPILSDLDEIITGKSATLEDMLRG